MLLVWQTSASSNGPLHLVDQMDEGATWELQGSRCFIERMDDVCAWLRVESQLQTQNAEILNEQPFRQLPYTYIAAGY